MAIKKDTLDQLLEGRDPQAVDSDAKCNPVDSIGSSTKKSGFPFRTPAFCSVSRGRRRLGEKEYRGPFSDAGGCTSLQELRWPYFRKMDRWMS